MNKGISLKVRRSGEADRVEIFERDNIKIGRLATAHLKLDDPKVSRIHAIIEVSAAGERIDILDMGSAEGTFVNGDKVTKARLNYGDEIRMGDTYVDLVPNEVVAQPEPVAAGAFATAATGSGCATTSFGTRST